MREPIFVKQNAKKWERFDQSATGDPDELADSFIQITDDLAYAKTFYPKSKTTVYLNGLAGRFHQSIYKNRTEKGNRFVTFWKYELPLLFYTYRKQLLYAFCFFMVFVLIGILSAMYDEDFVRLIMGDGYVDTTNANIARGEPFGVYNSESEFSMFFMIAVNNIYVSLRTYAFGIIFSVGSIYELFNNGVMLGAFQYYFFSKGLGMQSVLVIWIHGTLEISAIVIAGAAGLVLGNSFLFPKTYTRLVSLKKGAADSMKIAVGLIPIFITAAFLEGFVTRHTKMPLWLSIGILASSACFIIWYVIIYPRKLNRTQYGTL
ncbi:hypothetical protein A0256_03825 [Mucilaginibacter sp. PAMC 26640]|nr:hypothetical protein A0256_03825 [Mucilaginibacter sp. PAMC 26640]